MDWMMNIGSIFTDLCFYNRYGRNCQFYCSGHVQYKFRTFPFVSLPYKVINITIAGKAGVATAKPRYISLSS